MTKARRSGVPHPRREGTSRKTKPHRTCSLSRQLITLYACGGSLLLTCGSSMFRFHRYDKRVRRLILPSEIALEPRLKQSLRSCNGCERSGRINGVIDRDKVYLSLAVGKKSVEKCLEVLEFLRRSSSFPWSLTLVTAPI